MKSKNNIFKKSLLACVFLLLFFPLIQNNLKLFVVDRLKGVFDHAPDPEFSIEDWSALIFQKEKEVYINENFGFRELCVKLNNQLRFDLFKKNSNKEVVIGKDGYFFGTPYVKAYTGQDFVGENVLLKKCLLVKNIQQKLQQQGKVFLPVLAPNKVRLSFEYLPDGTVIKNKSNYEVLVDLFKKHNINYLDFNSHFVSINKTIKHPLFTKYATHWSAYGHSLAADSIINYLNFNYALNIPNMVWKDSIVVSDSLRDPDYNIVEGMDLLEGQMPSEKMDYPTSYFKNTENKKPSLFVIGDSFNLGLEKTDFQNKAFSNYKFLYYFKQVFPFTGDKLALYKFNLADEIKNHDVILLLTAEFNLEDYGWGFLEKASDILNGKVKAKDINYENKIHLFEFDIRNHKEWFAELKRTSEQKHLNLDTLVYKSAKYIIDQQYLKYDPDQQTRIKMMRESIQRDRNWLNDLPRKAKERNISVDSMLTLDAIWALNQKLR